MPPVDLIWSGVWDQGLGLEGLTLLVVDELIFPRKWQGFGTFIFF